jgi:hypothetical protein
LFVGCDLVSHEEVRQVFRSCENDPRALCFAALLGGFDEVRRVADLGDAFAQAKMAVHGFGEERFRWAEKLLLKENAMVSSTLDVATELKLDVRKM